MFHRHAPARPPRPATCHRRHVARLHCRPARVGRHTHRRRWSCAGRCTVQGQVQTLRVRPLAGTSTLECVIADDTGALSIVFLGRARIEGIRVGDVDAGHGHRGRSPRPARDLEPGLRLELRRRRVPRMTAADELGFAWAETSGPERIPEWMGPADFVAESERAANRLVLVPVGAWDLRTLRAVERARRRSRPRAARAACRRQRPRDGRAARAPGPAAAVRSRSASSRTTAASPRPSRGWCNSNWSAASRRWS